MKTAITTTLDLSSLPEQARQEVTDFYNFLKTKYRQRSAPRKASFKKPALPVNPGFIGMWSDRPEMSEPAKWVRELRENSWSRHDSTVKLSQITSEVYHGITQSTGILQ